MLFPAIVGFCCIGTYTVNSNVFDIFVMGFFAVFGYLCLKLDCEPAPLILGFVLGPLMEENLRRSLLISRGDPMVFLQEPISLAFLVASALLLVVVAAPAIRAKREEALQGRCHLASLSSLPAKAGRWLTGKKYSAPPT